MVFGDANEAMAKYLECSLAAGGGEEEEATDAATTAEAEPVEEVIMIEDSGDPAVGMVEEGSGDLAMVSGDPDLMEP